MKWGWGGSFEIPAGIVVTVLACEAGSKRWQKKTTEMKRGCASVCVCLSYGGARSKKKKKKAKIVFFRWSKIERREREWKWKKKKSMSHPLRPAAGTKNAATFVRTKVLGHKSPLTITSTSRLNGRQSCLPSSLLLCEAFMDEVGVVEQLKKVLSSQLSGEIQGMRREKGELTWRSCISSGRKFIYGFVFRVINLITC